MTSISLSFEHPLVAAESSTAPHTPSSLKTILKVIQSARENTALAPNPHPLTQERIQRILMALSESSPRSQLFELFIGMHLKENSLEALHSLIEACPQKDALFDIVYKVYGTSSHEQSWGKLQVLQTPSIIADALSLLSKPDADLCRFSEEQRAIINDFKKWEISKLHEILPIALHEAISKGDLQEVETLLSKDESVKQSVLAEALIKACFRGLKDIVMFLLRLKDEICEDRFMAAVIAASQNGHLEIIVSLLQSNSISAEAMPLLRQAIKESLHVSGAAITSPLSIVQEILLGREIPLEALQEALVDAAIGGHVELVRFLFTQGDIEPSALGKAAYYAAGNGHLEVVRFLADQSFIPTTTYSWKATCFIAGTKGRIDIVKFLIITDKIQSADALRSIALMVARTGDLELTNIVLDKLKAINPQQWSHALGECIETASGQGRLDFVQDLVRQVSSNFQDVLQSSVIAAAKNGHVHVIDFLLSEGRTIEDRYEILSALQEATKYGHMPVVTYFIDKGFKLSNYELNGFIKKAVSIGDKKNANLLLSRISLPEDLSLSRLCIDENGFVIDPKVVFFEAFFDIKDIGIRQQLCFEYLSLLLMRPDVLNRIWESKMEICKSHKNTNRHYLQFMLNWYLITKDEKKINDFLETLNASRESLSFFKKILGDYANFRPLLNCIYVLKNTLRTDRCVRICTDEKLEEILLELFSPSNSSTAKGNKNRNREFQTVISYMTALVSLRSLEWVDEFLVASDKEGVLSAHLLTSLGELVSMKITKDEFDKLMKSLRNPNAFMVFFQKVKDFPVIASLYSEVFKHLISGTFRELRNEKLSSEHIIHMQTYYPEIWTKWLGSGVVDAKSSVLQYMRELFAGKRHQLADGRVHPCLVGAQELLVKSKEELQAVFESMEKDRLEGATQNPNARTLRALLQMILSSDSESIKDAIDEALANLTLTEDEDCGLISDLISFKTSLDATSSSPSLKGLVLTNTDDFEDLFLSGTEVIGSCQSVIGTHSHCLLGYVADAKNRMIAIKSASGEIETRAIFRLLFEKSGPVLFLDSFYSKHHIIPEDHKAMINQHAKKVADYLGVDLYVFNISGNSNLQSLGSPSFYEYEDAAMSHGLTVTNGVFTVVLASLFYKPESA